MDMPGQSRVVDQNRSITHHAVVTHMDIGHQQVMATDGGFAAVLYVSTMNGDAFTDSGVSAVLQMGVLALVFRVAAVFTQRCGLEDAVGLANTRVPFDHHVGGDGAALTNLHIGPYDCPRAHNHIRSQTGVWVNNSVWIYQG